MPNTNVFRTECGRDILAVTYAPSHVNAMPQKYPTARSAVSLANLCKTTSGRSPLPRCIARKTTMTTAENRMVPRMSVASPANKATMRMRFTV